jgi:hypothetical protein
MAHDVLDQPSVSGPNGLDAAHGGNVENLEGSLLVSRTWLNFGTVWPLCSKYPFPVGPYCWKRQDGTRTGVIVGLSASSLNLLSSHGP